MADYEAFRWIGTISQAATAVGVGFAWFQIRLAQKHAVTKFEDDLDREYREIMEKLPVEAFYLESEYQPTANDDVRVFFRYFDLSNYQAFLRQNNRVTRETWDNWSDGMRSNFELRAFRCAWNLLKNRIDNRFMELRELDKEHFNIDPKSWPKKPRSDKKR